MVMLEYNMSRVENIYSRNKENILYLVFLEQISAKDLPLIILELIQTQSILNIPMMNMITLCSRINSETRCLDPIDTK